MKYFESYFKDTDFDTTNENGEVAVLCPFPHTTSSGMVYYETNPSAHVNTQKGVFHCKGCSTHHSEVSFVKEIEQISYKDALKLLQVMGEKHEDRNAWKPYVEKLDREFVRSYHITDDVINELQLGSKGQDKTFSVPVFVYGDLIDVRTYRPNQKPKWLSEVNTPTGMIIPDVVNLRHTEDIIWCAGEKDMLIARSKGYNAYCCTGGEMALPTLFKGQFRDKKVYIIYDNDDTGKSGAVKMATFVYENGGTPYVVFGHHAVCVNKGEDLWDYFCTYGKSTSDFDLLLHETQPFNEEEYNKALEKIFPTKTLQQLQDGDLMDGKFFRATVQVSAVFNQTFGVPEVVTFTKTEADEKGEWVYGREESWYLEEENCQHALYLCDKGLNEDKVHANLRRFVNVPAKERFIKMSKSATIPVYKASITDLYNFEYSADVEQRSPVEFVAYGIKCGLEAGKNYNIRGKVVAHPIQAGERVIVLVEANPISLEVDNFKVTDEVKQHLDVFRGENVKEELDKQFKQAKGFLPSGCPEVMFHATDLYFHTPNYIKPGRDRIRGYLDVMCVGDTRTGKSSTAQALMSMYGKGNVLSLKTSTTQSLIGGTDKSTNSTKLGLIPRHHRGAVILEEFSTADPTFIKTITEIRSSGVVTLSRVDKTIQAPCSVRTLTISNPKPQRDGTTLTVGEYPNGVKLLEELVGAHEDIARYDMVFLLPSKSHESDYDYGGFETVTSEHPDKEAYIARLNWVWSRTVDQIKFPQETLDQFRVSCLNLNKKMDCSVKLLGQELNKKLARLATAVAGRVVSTDDYENLIVKPEHVIWAEQFLNDLYDNEYFKFKTYADEERMYIECDQVDIDEAQRLYINQTELLEHLEHASVTNRASMRDASGMTLDAFSTTMRELIKLRFIKLRGDSVTPTIKLKRAMRQIDRSVKAGLTIGNTPF